jgi:hypothetical protein
LGLFSASNHRDIVRGGRVSNKTQRPVASLHVLGSGLRSVELG